MKRTDEMNEETAKNLLACAAIEMARAVDETDGGLVYIRDAPGFRKALANVDAAHRIIRRPAAGGSP